MFSGEFIVYFNEYVGDFDLILTMNSGQTSQPPWKMDDNNYYEIILIDNIDVLVKISQEKLNDPLIVKYFSKEEFNVEKLRTKLFYIFDLDYNINEVYDFLEENSQLSDVYEFNRGLRLFKSQFPFECIISSICSANNSIKRWTKSLYDIRRFCGRSVVFGKDTYYVFPREEVFINMSLDELKNCGVGYRNKYMLNSTEKIRDSIDFHENIFKLSYKKAYNEIIKLEGVGPKVADCILLYGYNKHEAYPVDVWINRITTYLYFKNQKVSNGKISSFAHETFGMYAGYIQLYLFNYARLSGLMSKLKEI